MRRGAGKVAAYRDDDGTLHEVSAICTHLGCQVKWNEAERSWDCPCHGSRFDFDRPRDPGPGGEGPRAEAGGLGRIQVRTGFLGRFPCGA